MSAPPKAPNSHGERPFRAFQVAITPAMSASTSGERATRRPRARVFTGIAAQKVRAALDLTGRSGARRTLLELSLELEAGDAGLIALTFRNSLGQQTVFRINRRQHRYELDRSASGAVEFSHAFSSLQTAPITTQRGTVGLRAFVDHSSIEIFIDGGETVFTTIAFPTTPHDVVSLSADRDVDLRSATISELRGVWPAR